MKNPKSKKILIIDDDKHMRDILSSLLSRYYDVKTAEDGNKGVKLIHAYNPDLLITDIIMPNFDGLETIAYIRKNHGDIGIIAISGRFSSDIYLNLATEFGADKTHSKPFNPQDILNSVEELLKAENPDIDHINC